MRFDDVLTTVMTADMTSDVGARSAWRQIVDLVGHGRVPPDAGTLKMLRRLKRDVPVEVRSASARMLADAKPPLALVTLLADDEPPVVAATLSSASLETEDWTTLLPTLDPFGRSVLRQRRDLPDPVVRALAAFGPIDFALPRPPWATQDTALPSGDGTAIAGSDEPAPRPAAPADSTPRPPAEVSPRFEIADLVARIAAFQEGRPPRPLDGSACLAATSTGRPLRAPPSPAPPAPGGGFVFETDATGTIRWVDGIPRGSLVGMSLAVDGVRGLIRLDAVAPAALRRRQPFRDARLELGGRSPASGSWRLSGVPMFDAASGRFNGIRGSGRRPRRDEEAAPAEPAPDSLRQLVHELRTPTNAIIGFAELIGAELFGDVPDRYRARAETIRSQASALIGAIEDLDMAARIEGQALELRPGAVALAPLLVRIIADLTPLMTLRRVELTIGAVPPDLVLAADDRAAERLIARLLSAIVAAGVSGERINVAVMQENDTAMLSIDCPRALASDDPDTLFRLDGVEAGADGTPLLGIAFTLRLARNLAAELGGELRLAPTMLTLCLPATDGHPRGDVAAV